MKMHKLIVKALEDLKEIVPQLGDNNYNYDTIELLSKKNLIFNLVFDKKPSNFPKESIIKIFITPNIANEYNILTRLKNQNFHVPKILFLKNPYLVLEKVNGINLCDFINENLKKVEKLNDLNSDLRNKMIHAVESLANWLVQLHEKNIVRKKEFSEIFVLNKGDTRLRDFIMDFSENVLYGVDFEEAYEGSHIDDLAWVCCSLLDTNPGIFEMEEPTHKVDLINIFLRKYYQSSSSFQFNFNYLAEKLIEDLNIVIERRNLPYGVISKAKFIEDISKEI
ncbi:MAG: hypothetical protein ACFFHD_06400 [Promethearchaeota archaeon]